MSHVQVPTTIFGRPLDMVFPFVDSWIVPCIRQTGKWEEVETSLICNALKPGGVFVDMGANCGWHTLHAASIVGPEGSVWSVEPDSDNFECLGTNVERFGVSDRVRLVRAAGWCCETELILYHDSKEHGDHRVAKDSTKADMGTPQPVPAITLDHLLRENRHVDVLKIDTQGAETLILAGARQVLESSPDIKITFEWCPKMILACKGDPTSVGRLLEGHGLRCRLIWDLQAEWLTQRERRDGDPLLIDMDWEEIKDLLLDRAPDRHCNVFASRVY